MIESLTVLGLRGFSTPQTVEFSPAIDEDHLGLTVIVGANSSGKSTIVEAFRALIQNEPPSFSLGKRNVSAGNRVEITIKLADGTASTVKTIRSGGSESEFINRTTENLRRDILVLPSRRVFAPYFGKHTATRSKYMSQLGFPAVRSSQLDQFSSRLFAIEQNRSEFDSVLFEVTGSSINWSIDQSDQGQYFINILSDNGGFHSSDGMGEGLVSLMFIIDALYDSIPGQTIIIDEPELSLHPQYQKSLLRLFKKYASNRQIILLTHSPYFVDMESLSTGMRIHRVSSDITGSHVHSLKSETAERIARFITNDNNPHIVGLAAREALFSGDKLVLLEGQEDVVFIDRVLADLNLTLDAVPFGWGVGGAENMASVAQMLADLGFAKVVGILDGDKADKRDEFRLMFPEFHFDCIPTDDIRTKKPAKARGGKSGLLDDENLRVRPEHREAATRVFVAANEYLSG